MSNRSALSVYGRIMLALNTPAQGLAEPIKARASPLRITPTITAAYPAFEVTELEPELVSWAVLAQATPSKTYTLSVALQGWDAQVYTLSELP